MSTYLTSLEAEGQKKRETAAIIVSVIFGILFIIILLFPWLSNALSTPEASGLMASFGNVEMAGGDANTPDPENETTTTTTTENSSEDVTTTENEEDPSIENNDSDDNNPSEENNTNNDPNPNPNPNPNPKAVFGGGGKGEDKGGGDQGNPFGSKDISGKGQGFGDSGDGTGKVGNRKIIDKCDKSIINKASSSENGVAWVYICVKENGQVESAEFVRKTKRGDVSTISSSTLKSIAVECAKGYRYENALGKGKACGSIPIRFGFQ